MTADTTNTVRLHRVVRTKPEHVPAEACCLGWQESLTLLAKRVEAGIPDQS
jgi:hypothetical protein